MSTENGKEKGDKDKEKDRKKRDKSSGSDSSADRSKSKKGKERDGRGSRKRYDISARQCRPKSVGSKDPGFCLEYRGNILIQCI